MKLRDIIRKAYDTTATAYAEEFQDELEKKSLDRLLLQRFAKENKEKGKCLDLGCGPGQTTLFLAKAGMEDLVGMDLSEGMISAAKMKRSKALQFVQADMLDLPIKAGQIGSILCFYGIVHFQLDELASAVKEWWRVLKNGGQVLFSFHVGSEQRDLNTFLGEEVDITFYFFEIDQVIELLKAQGFAVLEVIERHPYPIEYPSQRAYILVER